MEQGNENPPSTESVATKARTMDLEAVKSLGELYEKSVERTRRVWLVLQIFTIVVFIAVFNHRFSWFRTKMVRDAIKIEQMGHHTDSLNPATLAEVLSYSHHKAVEHEGKMKFIELDWIGSEVYADDLPIMGSVALSILLAWYIFTYRRMVGILKRIQGLFADGRLRSSGKELLRDHVGFIQVFNETEHDRGALNAGGQEEHGLGLRSAKWALWLSKKGLRFLVSAPLWLLVVIWGLDGFETFIAKRPEVKDFIAKKPIADPKDKADSLYRFTTWNIFFHPSEELRNEAKKHGITDHIGFNAVEIWIRTCIPFLVFLLCLAQLGAAKRLWRNEEAFSSKILEDMGSLKDEVASGG